MGSVKINEIVQEKLRDFKEESGSKTFSDAINLLLSEHSKLLHRDFVKLANDYTDLKLVVSKLKKENKELKKGRKEFVKDLDEIIEWCKYLPVDSEINIRLGRKVEKWEVKK